jgi:hypothetical protein
MFNTNYFLFRTSSQLHCLKQKYNIADKKKRFDNLACGIANFAARDFYVG